MWSLKDSSLTLGRTWLHHKSLLLPTDWTRIHTESRYYAKWSCKSVLRAKTDQREAPLSWTSHIPISWTWHWINVTVPRAFALGIWKDFHWLHQKKKFLQHILDGKEKTKSNLGPSWVDELPATFIIQRNYSAGDSWVLKHTDFLPA